MARADSASLEPLQPLRDVVIVFEEEPGARGDGFAGDLVDVGGLRQPRAGQGDHADRMILEQQRHGDHGVEAAHQRGDLVAALLGLGRLVDLGLAGAAAGAAGGLAAAFFACMERALALAARGQGRTSPNPVVGAVVVSGDGVVV